MSDEPKAGAGQLISQFYASNFYLLTDNVAFTVVFTNRKLVLGDASPSNAKIEATIIPVGAVEISPQLAKELSRVLADAVAEYEKAYGTIPSMEAKKG